MPQPAYNLADFAPRTAPQRRLRVAPPAPQRRARARAQVLRRVRLAAAVTVMLALICSVIYSQAQLTELGGQIADAQQQLADAQSEYTYYNNEMTMRHSMDSVSAYASSELGLVKMDKSQITYINTGSDNRIRRDENALEKLLDDTAAGAMDIMEYIAP